MWIPALITLGIGGLLYASRPRVRNWTNVSSLAPGKTHRIIATMHEPPGSQVGLEAALQRAGFADAKLVERAPAFEGATYTYDALATLPGYPTLSAPGIGVYSYSRYE